MRVERIYLRHVGPFNEATITLPPPPQTGLADVQLLTGPNGAGKSTLLYAIAGALTWNSRFGPDLCASRLRDSESVAVADLGPTAKVGIRAGMSGQLPAELPDPLDDRLLGMQQGGGHVGYYLWTSDNDFSNYRNRAFSFSAKTPPESRPRFSWAAFAYAGLRDVSEVQIEAPSEPGDNPFENSLSFIHTADTKRLAQWVANQDFKRLKAKEAGLAETAEQLQRTIRQMEGIISEITGIAFAFVTTYEDNNVRVQINGKVVPLGLMPDGLKSIVSWIADLLMRLDRIPWIDDIPPLERQFLLLLDEVDIHLHPSWQRRVLPIVQRMFPNAQIIASTHSPFVICSLNHGWVHSLKVNADGVATAREPLPACEGDSYISVLEEIMEVPEWYDPETEDLLAKFRQFRDAAYRGDPAAEPSARGIAEQIAARGSELRFMIGRELSQMDKQLRQPA